jgi:hypothetical protein
MQISIQILEPLLDLTEVVAEPVKLLTYLFAVYLTTLSVAQTI